MDKPVYSVKGHKSLINCIDGIGGLNVGYGAPELVTGSRDGSVKVWDPRARDSVVRRVCDMCALVHLPAKEGIEGKRVCLQ